MRSSGAKSVAMMMMLPEELLIEILTRLTGKPLGRCKCVCKSWLSLIKSRTFFEVYRSREPSLIMCWADNIHGEGFRLNCVYSTLRRSKESAEKFSHLSQFVGLKNYYRKELTTEVVNGLVCIRETDLRLTICNVCTGQGMRLPDPKRYTSDDRLTRFYLGYNPTTKVYKLLRLIFTYQLKAEVMTLKPSNTLSKWRKLNNSGCGIGFRPASVISFSGGLVSADGFLWWLSRSGYLLSFDLDAEKFQWIKLPEDMRSAVQSNMVFIQSMGRPAIWVIPRTSDPRCFVLFVFENDNIWSKHSIPFPEELGQVSWIVNSGNLPTGEILLMNVELRYEHFLPTAAILPMNVELLDEELRDYDVPFMRYQDYKTPVYSYNHRTNKFDRFLVGKLHKNECLYYRRGSCSKHIRHGIAKISCVHVNNNFYLPLDDVLSGTV